MEYCIPIIFVIIGVQINYNSKVHKNLRHIINNTVKSMCNIKISDALINIYVMCII